ncbi:MAG: hypothetical protein GEU91_15425 [Rhizobiales bacterium]|nr:hypothetical protein [Hyphomicrobiales bacterium]
MSDAEQRRLAILSSLEAQLDGSAGERRGRAGQPAQSAAGGGAERQPGEQQPENRQSGGGQDQLLRSHRDRSERNQRRAAALARRAEAAAKQEPVAPRRLDEVARVTPIPQVFDGNKVEDLPPLPQRGGKRSVVTFLSFLLCVILPTMVASVYYIFVASNQYVSEFRFAVRELSQTSASSSSLSGLASLLGATSATSNSADNFMVTEYLTSRQVADELQANIKVRDLYSRPNVDWWARFDRLQPMEKFVSYWQNMVTANYDQITGVAVAQVRAFTPDDAYLIATTMVSLAEKLVNEISTRPRMDAVKFAEREVKRAEDRLRQIRTQIGDYRDKESLIEPNSSVVTSNNTLAQSLRATLVQYQTELAALTNQKLRPDAPYIVNLRSRIAAAREQLAAVEAQIANSKEGNRSLSSVVGQYEQLDLDRQFAQTILTSAVQTLEQARASAISQHLYVTPFVRPARPESSTYPNRIVSILTIGLGCFFIWTIGLLVVRSIREHLA